MTTKTDKQVRSFFYNHARDLYRILDSDKTMVIRLVASNEFADKLERRCEKAGFTIVHWGSVVHTAHEFDIEIEVRSAFDRKIDSMFTSEGR